MPELEILSRAHRLFGGAALPASFETAVDLHGSALIRTAEQRSGSAADRYREVLQASRIDVKDAARTDAALAAVIAEARRDHATARELTRRVLAAAHTDAAAPPQSPLAEREAIRRRVARLRAQHDHVATARRRAARRLAALRVLRYLAMRRAGGRGGLPLAPPDSRAGIAVRAALSRLGRPYVWGATGPEQFDCSGLVQWSYRQAGVHLDRTTYEQINDGIPVPRAQVRPGDLVFPHAGHVQMAIGNGMVVEAPYTGTTVRISPLGQNVTIRRPLG